MQSIFRHKIREILELGINPTISNLDKVKIKIYNYFLLLNLSFQGLILLLKIIYPTFYGVYIMSILMIITTSLILLNKYNKVRLSIFLFNIIHPILILGLVFLYEQPNDLEYAFIVYIITTLLLQNGLFERLLIVSLPISGLLYTISGHRWIGYFQEDLSYYTNYAVLMTCIFTILFPLIYLAWELRKYDDKLNNLIIELGNANKELIEKNKELERFSYVVSHDMKTPLRAVAGYINIIEKKSKGIESDSLKYFSYIKESVTQLNNLVVETLEFSKTGKDDIQFEIVDVNEILFKLSRDFSTKDIEIYTEEFPNVLGNKVLVNKLFQNLIENGGKYNNSTEKIIDITHEIKNDKVIFSIKDNGIGIEEKYHTQIFEMYKRLHTKKEYTGTGLGLSICKKIAKRLEGDIYLTSELGKGTTFYLELQLAK